MVDLLLQSLFNGRWDLVDVLGSGKQLDLAASIPTRSMWQSGPDHPDHNQRQHSLCSTTIR